MNLFVLLTILLCLSSAPAVAQEEPQAPQACATAEQIMPMASIGANPRFVMYDKDEALDDIRNFLLMTYKIPRADLYDVAKVFLLEYPHYAAVFMFKSDGCFNMSLPFNFKDGKLLIDLLRQEHKKS